MSFDPVPRPLVLRAGGRRLEAVELGETRPGQPVLVFLHEGLGSVSQWRGFPAQLCAALGLPGLVYSRAGYGLSDPAVLPRTPGFLHAEAEVLDELITNAGITQAVLVGHSDGGSIALLYAARRPAALRATIAIAPHLFVEPVTLAAIRALRERHAQGDFAARLARHHRDPDATFHGWTGAWLDPAFVGWSIEAEMARIVSPVLALQGEQDAYGTMAQVQRVAELAAGARWQGLPDCGHHPFVDRPEAVIDAIGAFLRTALPTGPA
jgi:pimeloyl-ACP methyl ester carboxylesterase